jgi:hypothetical protein
LSGCVIALLGLLWLAPPLASAAELTVVAGEGESLKALAERLYGNPGLARSLALLNERDAPLEPGDVVRLPFADEHTAVEGDTWDGLAKRYWGDAARGPALATLMDSDAPAAGETVLVPALLPYEIQAGQTFAAISRLMFDTSSWASALATLNGVDPRSLHPGQIVQVPVLTQVPGPDSIELAPDVPAAPELPAVPQPVSAAPVPLTRRGEELDQAVATHDAGDFESALALLEGLREEMMEWGSYEQRHLLLSELVELYVAFERPSATCRTYRELRRLDPGLEWDDVRVSPKVIRMTRGC